MASGSGLLFFVSCALAEVKREAAMSQSAMKDFRCFLLMGFAPVILSSFLLENFLGNVDGVYRVRPAKVERQVSDGLGQLFLRHAVFARSHEVRPELFWTVQGNQRSHSHQASVALRQLRTFPDVAVQHVVSQLRQLGSKVADRSLRRPRLPVGS